ncbi:hypothetical protein BCR32DRAFT_300525 [Anaeromyces robustus]|uniref:DUF5745 domain-containing protein n=1 Tax=Anaeromyces robustus TaxID=1754192 RepID=A0A1Y1XM49_9FUNG|nr:hypothetical protein BCR32DRAFT_300525 [Anaeromyces robustus]|eukprot:ORX86801.1 hypothetical protein BCR32DRAFT_300525 [Anaeromyces robustus]
MDYEKQNFIILDDSDTSLNNIDINDTEGIDIINNILHSIGIPLKIKSLNECVSSLWVVIYEGIFKIRLENIIRSQNAVYTETKIMNIQLILDQLKEKYGISFPSKMAYELFSGNKSFIIKLIYIFKIIYDRKNQNNTFKEIKNELQKLVQILFKNETNTSQSIEINHYHNQSNKNFLVKNKKLFSNKKNAKTKKREKSKIKKLNQSNQKFKNNNDNKKEEEDLKVIDLDNTINDININNNQISEKVLDHVNLEDSQLNFLLNSDNYPLKHQNLKVNINKDDDIETKSISTQKSCKSNRTRSGTNKFIKLNDDIYNYIIVNKIEDNKNNNYYNNNIGFSNLNTELTFKINNIHQVNQINNKKNINSSNNDNNSNNNSNNNNIIRIKKKKKIEKKENRQSKAINPKKPKKNSKLHFELNNITNEKITKNYNEIKSLKKKFSLIQSEIQKLNGIIDKSHLKNPNTLLETHRTKAYINNIKTYADVVQKSNPLIKKLRNCNYFHYIGEDHNVHFLDSPDINELDEKLKKKKAIVKEIMGKNINSLEEMKYEYIIDDKDKENDPLQSKKKLSDYEFHRKIKNNDFEKRRKEVALNNMQKEINQIIDNKQNIISFNKSLKEELLIKIK